MAAGIVAASLMSVAGCTGGEGTGDGSTPPTGDALGGLPTAAGYSFVGMGSDERATRTDSFVENVAGSTVTITDVTLAGESLDLGLHRAVVVRGGQSIAANGPGWPPDGLGPSARARYAERAEPAVGAEIDPGEAVWLTLLLSFDRADGPDTSARGTTRYGGSQGYTVTYEVDGETFEQTASTGFWVCAPRCPATDVMESEIDIPTSLPSSSDS